MCAGQDKYISHYILVCPTLRSKVIANSIILQTCQNSTMLEMNFDFVAISVSYFLSWVSLHVLFLWTDHLRRSATLPKPSLRIFRLNPLNVTIRVSALQSTERDLITVIHMRVRSRLWTSQSFIRTRCGKSGKLL